MSASPIVHNIVRSSLRDFPIKYHGDMTWHTAMKLGNKKYFELHPLPPVISIQSLEQIKIRQTLVKGHHSHIPLILFLIASPTITHILFIRIPSCPDFIYPLVQSIDWWNKHKRSVQCTLHLSISHVPGDRSMEMSHRLLRLIQMCKGMWNKFNISLRY